MSRVQKSQKVTKIQFLDGVDAVSPFFDFEELIASDRGGKTRINLENIWGPIPAILTKF